MKILKSKFAIFHFNDVYDIQQSVKQPKAGAAYFKSLLDRNRQPYKNKLTLFSGDAFSPSLLASQYKGQHMIKPLNAIQIDLACLGNHDLDYNYDQVLKLKQSSNFSWLLSNIYDKRTQKRLMNADEYKIFEINDLKIGIFNLAQKQWIDVLIHEYRDNCYYIPFIQFAQQMVIKLKNQKCDIIIALTHMMKYNDIKLAENVNGIDLILGGHDHLIIQQLVNNSVIVKSGTNFRNFSKIQIYPRQPNDNKNDDLFDQNVKCFINKNWQFRITLYEVNHQKQKIVPDPQLFQYITQLYKDFQIKQKRIALYTKGQIDLQFKTIRKQQSSFLEFLAEYYRFYAQADCGFMNSGNFRSDCLLNQGIISYGTLIHCIEDNIAVKIITGSCIIKCLQNCVSLYPNLAGRFSALSGLSFTWDSARQQYSRVLIQTVKINNQPIDLKKKYRVVFHEFMSLGGDGFQFLKQFPFAQDFEPLLNKILLQQLAKPEQSQLIKRFQERNKDLFQIIQHNGQKLIELNLPKPKNVKMINC